MDVDSSSSRERECCESSSHHRGVGLTPRIPLRPVLRFRDFLVDLEPV